MKMSPMKKILQVFLPALMVACLSVACAEKVPVDEVPLHIEPAEDPSVPELNILFIGNSFTMDAVTHLPGLVSAAGIKKVHMIHMYYGGRLVQQYNSGWETSADYTGYECQPGDSGWRTFKGKTLAEVAASKEWDIVTIQEHTGNKCAWTWNATQKSHFTQLMNKVRYSQKKEPKFYYILSQAYQNNEKIGSGSRPSITWTEHTGMWNVLAAFGRNVMKDVPFDGIISTGAMLENLRSTSFNNELGLTRDGYHMDKGLACYGASCTVFETLISPVYDVRLDKNRYRSSSAGTPITDENAPVALQAARLAIANPYSIMDMSGR